MDKPEKRRSSILKAQQTANVDTAEPTVTNTVTTGSRRRVSFKSVRTVQKFDAEQTDLVQSPHHEPIKLHDTGSSDGMTSNRTFDVNVKSSHDLSRTVENFIPQIASTPMPHSRKTALLADDSQFFTCDSMQDDGDDMSCDTSGSTAIEDEKSVVVQNLHDTEQKQDENFDILSMEMSGSFAQESESGNLTEALVKRIQSPISNISSAEKKQTTPFDTINSMRSKRLSNNKSLFEQSSASLNTRALFNQPTGRKSKLIRRETMVTSAQLSSSNDSSLPPNATCALLRRNYDMLSSSDQSAVNENDDKAASKSPTTITAELLYEDGNQCDMMEQVKSIVEDESENIESMDQLCLPENQGPLESTEPPIKANKRPHPRTISARDNTSHSTATLDISSRLEQQHISNIQSPSRNLPPAQMFESPMALPCKKSRLISPRQYSSPRSGSLSKNASMLNTKSCSPMKVSFFKSTNMTHSIGSANTDDLDPVSKLRNRARRSLNQSGFFSWAEFTNAFNRSPKMLQDINDPEPIIDMQSTQASSELVGQEERISEFDLEPEPWLDIGAIISRQSFINNNSSFALTNKLENLHFEINIGDIPCLRIMVGDQPEIVALKKNAMSNLRAMIQTANKNCEDHIAQKLDDLSKRDRKLAESIRTVNPKKLSRLEVSRFEVCRLFAQREWFNLRYTLALATLNKIKEVMDSMDAVYVKKQEEIELIKKLNVREKSDSELEEQIDELKKIENALSHHEKTTSELRDKESEISKLELQNGLLLLEVTKKKCQAINKKLDERDEWRRHEEIQKSEREERRRELFRKLDIKMQFLNEL